MLNALIGRRSIRKYKPEQISEEALHAILAAGTWAPSAMNLQSAVMVVVQDKEAVMALSRLNAAVLGKEGVDPFFGAPTVVVVLADTTKLCWLQDGSLVMGNLMNAAYMQGVGSCWINRAKEVFEMEEGKAILGKWGFGENYAGVANCILGYADEQPVPKPRKEDYIFWVQADADFAASRFIGKHTSHSTI